MNIDWFIVGVILAVVVLIGLVYRYHTKGAAEIKPSSFVTEALSGLEAPKSVDPEDDPLGQLQPMLDTLHFNYPERENYIKVKKEHGDSKQTEKALFERALGCVAKIIHMQKCFPILQNARQGNILPDELWELTQNKMKEIDDEYQDIRKEADSMVQNGGATIFQQASMIFNQIQQQQMAQMRAQQQQQQQQQQQPQQQVEAKKSGETKPVEKEKEKEKPKPPDAKTIEQQKAAAEKAYKELLKEEANSGKKSKKSKKDE